MLKYLLPIGIVYLILAVIGVILIIREVKKENNKDDMTLIIISFLVPLIGLIIYAVNVGKDKHITECALKGVKMYLKLLVAQFIISVIVVLLMVLVFNANTNKTVKVREDVKETITVPIKIKYNEEAFFIENVPQTMEVTVQGKKADIYLLKQEDFYITLDLSNYKPSDSPYLVYYEFDKPISSLMYKIENDSVSVLIQEKIITTKAVVPKVINEDYLDNFSIKNIELDIQDAIVKGSNKSVKRVSNIGAVINLKELQIKEEGVYTVKVDLLAYDGNFPTSNVEVVPNKANAIITVK